MNNIQNLMMKGLALFQAGKLKKAGQCFRTVLRSDPRHPDALMLLGIVQYENCEFANAISTLLKATEVTPKRAEAHFNLGLSFQASGKHEKARQAFECSLSLEPNNNQTEYCLGVAQIQSGEIQEGAMRLHGLRAAMPDNPGLFGWLGTAMQRLGNAPSAAKAFTRALQLDPENYQALLGMTMIPTTVVPIGTAFSCAEKAAAKYPSRGMALAVYAWWLERRGDIDEAYEYIKRALKIDPQNHKAIVVLARIELAQGQAQAACDRVRNLLGKDGLDAAVRRDAYAVLGTALDKLALYDEAFLAFDHMRGLVASLPETDGIDADFIPKLMERTLDWLMAGEAKKRQPRSAQSSRSATPIFFIGFPRSGTTLMENVLGSHPALQTSGEWPALERVFLSLNSIVQREIDYPNDLLKLTGEQLEALRKIYWEQFAGQLEAPPDERVLVDKNPYNLIYVPLLHVLFPSAKVIMAHRDPRDACLSNLMQHFQVNNIMIQMTDAISTARLYVNYMALWRCARDALDLDYIEYRYEDLVDHFDETVSHILNHLGLDWDNSVREFARTAQGKIISTPSYSGVTGKLSRKAVGRWRNYEKQMAEACEILRPEVLALGYADD